MAVMDPDPDDLFFAIMEGVVLEEPVDAVDYTKLDDVELAKARAKVRAELFEMGEMHNLNAVGRAAELHSMFAAIDAVMKQRWGPTDD